MKKQNPRPRNRRVSNFRQRRQQHLLDVKVRSRTAAQHRNRRIVVFFSKMCLLAAAVAGVCLGGRRLADRFFFDNPDYQVNTIDVQTDGTLQREQVLREASLHEGENIFRINLSDVHDRLQALPQVDEVEVVRRLPSEIDIKLVERKPIAWITSEKDMADPFSADNAFLVDGRGVLMKQKKLLPEYLGLPLISGCTSESLEAGKTVESYEARSALELLRMSSRSLLETRFQIRQIDLAKGYCLFVTDKNHVQVAFGFENLDAQLQRLEKFLVYADNTKQELATVNLLVQRNIPVTFGKRSADVINDTIDPNEQTRALKTTAAPSPKFGTFSAPGPSATATPRPKKALAVTKSQAKSSSAEVRRAEPVTQPRKN